MATTTIRERIESHLVWWSGSVGIAGVLLGVGLVRLLVEVAGTDPVPRGTYELKADVDRNYVRRETVKADFIPVAEVNRDFVSRSEVERAYVSREVVAARYLSREYVDVNYVPLGIVKDYYVLRSLVDVSGSPAKRVDEPSAPRTPSDDETRTESQVSGMKEGTHSSEPLRDPGSLPSYEDHRLTLRIASVERESSGVLKVVVGVTNHMERPEWYGLHWDRPPYVLDSKGARLPCAATSLVTDGKRQQFPAGREVLWWLRFGPPAPTGHLCDLFLTLLRVNESGTSGYDAVETQFGGLEIKAAGS